MSFRDFVDEAKDLINKALASLGYDVPQKLDWDFPPSIELGDVSFRVGYQLSKIAKKKPPEIAREIAGEIEEKLSSEKHFVSSVEGHPNGFLNFRIKLEEFSSAVLLEARRKEYGGLNLGNDKSVLVEHTSVNPNKALHVGHFRNVALGDSIARILRFTHHDVKVLNYIDDSGLQVADVLVGVLYLGHSIEAPSGKKYDHYVGDDVYVDVNKQYERDPSLKEKQKFVLKAIEEHDAGIFPLAASITDKILKEQLHTCWRFNASYDLLVYESDIIDSKLWDHSFSELKNRGIAILEREGKLAGCWIVTIKGEKEGEDKVLVRSDGTATYIAKDIPFAALKTGLVSDNFTYKTYVKEPTSHELWRTSTDPKDSRQSPVIWGADKSVTAIGSEQSRLQRVILAVLENLANRDLSGVYIHLAYSLVALTPETVAAIQRKSKLLEQGGVEVKDSPDASAASVRMSGRKGLYVNADDVFDAVKEAALEETKKRNPEITDASWFDTVSEKLALSAIRFGLLKQDLDKTITFDLNESLKLVGETGPYMLYTYARAKSILAKASPAERKKVKGELLASESEVALLMILSKWDLSVEKAVNMLAPKWIAHYSFELCEAFNKFYEKNRVLQVDDPELRDARLLLVEDFATTIQKSLGLLGIDVLPKI